jgi:hypothetical protein
MLRRGALLIAFAVACLQGMSAGAAPAGADDDEAPARGAAPARGGRAYPIRLTRPFKVGQQFRWNADATVINSIPAPAAAAQAPAVAETVSLHLDGVVQILAVDRDGECTEMACTVDECTARTSKEKKVVVRQGRVILIEAGKWKSKLTAAAGTLTIEDDVLLRSVLSLPRVDDTSDDDLFGSPRPQAVGESWNLRPDQMVRSWGWAGYKLKPQQISGSVKVKSAETVDGVECVRVTGRARIEHFLPPALDVPEGLQIEDATCEIKFTRLLPADPSLPAVQDSHSVSVHFVLKKDPRALTPAPREGKLLRSVGVKMQPLPG